MTLMGQYTFFDLQFSTRYEDLSWCWRFLHHCSIDTCQLHVTVGSGLVHCLATEGHFTRLRQFVSSLSVDEYAVLYGNEKFIRAMIGLYVEEENYLGALCFLKVSLNVSSCLCSNKSLRVFPRVCVRARSVPLIFHIVQCSCFVKLWPKLLRFYFSCM